MSGSVDDEVVRMRFDNNAFERAVSTTLGTLAKLKNSLSFGGAGKGLDDLDAKANKFNLDGMNNAVDGSAHHWSLWRSAGLIAFATVVHQAVLAGERVVKAFTLDPVKAGFANYETQINAVQTILANTGLKGSKGLGQVNTALNKLNTYANQTIYSFSEMAKNIGTFTAAGVKLKPATNAIKGIANLAALSGSNSQQASTAMYQLSQAIAANKVGLQDWNSVVNAGMGGKVFQNALFNAGKLQGTLKGVKANETFDQWTKAGNSFRQSLQSGWITGKVLTSTLSQFTGDLTDAQLKAQGYNATQIKQIQELAKTASGAATHIKTFTQLTDALKEEVASAYSAVFKTIFGDINGATKLFTGLHNVLENALTTPIYALNTLLQKVTALGGRAKVIDAIKNVFHALGAVLKPIQAAFREFFPPATAKQITDIITKIDDFTKKLKIGADTADKIKRTFAGVFAVFDIGKQIVIGIAHVFAGLFQTVSGGAGGFLSIAAHVGDMLVAFDKAIKQGDVIQNVFQILSNLVGIVTHAFGLAGIAISQVFSNFHFKDADDLKNSVTKTGDGLSKLVDITGKFSDLMASLGSKIRPGVQSVVNGFKKIGAAIANAFGSQTFSNILSTINTGLFAGIVILFKKFLSHGLNVDIGGGMFGKIGEAIEGVTGNLKAMQTELKAKALLEIAGAMGILALSMVALAMINPSKLESAMKAMAIGFGELLGAMGILTKITGSAGFVKIPVMAASLGILAGAMLLLSASVYLLSRLSWEELQKGLTAVGILLAALSASAVVLSRNSGGMISAGLGITAMAVGLNLLYLAVKAFSTMSWGEMLKGLAGVGIALAGIALVMHAMPKGMIAQSAGIAILAVALNALYLAVKEFSTLSWKEMLKGLTGVAGALAGIALAMHLMPKGMIAQSVALIAVGAALQLIAKAVESMAQMSWSEIGKGLATLAASLAILGIALYGMTGTLAGAAALLVVAAGLRIFVPVLQALGSMSWGKILKGLGALAISFAVIGVAGLLLTPVIPALLGLGVALGILGVAMLAFGAGAALLGIGLTAIAASGGAAIGVLLSGLKGFIELLPTMATNLATALVSFITIIGKNAPQIIGAFVSLLQSLLDSVPKLMPSLITAIGSIIQTILTVLVDNAPKIIAAGLQLLMDLLNGIKNNIGKVTTQVIDIITKFLDAIAAHIGQIVAAGVNVLVQFLKGIANNIGKVVSAATSIVTSFIGAISNSIGRVISAGTNMIIKFISGIGTAGAKIVTAGVDTIIKFITALGSQGVRLANAAGQTILDFINGLNDAVRKYEYKIIQAMIRLGGSMIDGLVQGFGDIASHVGSSIGHGISGAASWVGDFIGAGGPSKMFADRVGIHIPEGIAQGVNNGTGTVLDSLKNLSTKSLSEMKKTMSGISDAISMNDPNFRPTITPILDLTQVQKDATQISGIVTPAPIRPQVSSAQAQQISSERTALADVDQAANAPGLREAPQFIFQQTNNSPKALSTLDTYRQTKNLLSQTKTALKI